MIARPDPYMHAQDAKVEELKKKLILKENFSVDLLVSDPWEYAGLLRSGGLFIIENESAALLLKLNSPILYDNKDENYFVVSARHKGTNLKESIMQGEEVSCGLTMIPEKRAHGSEPLDLSWWRGGLAMIGSLKKQVKRK